MVSDEGSFNARFCYWSDNDAGAYLPEGEGDKAGVWHSLDETGYLSVLSPSCYIFAYDLLNKEYYLCRSESGLCNHIYIGHSMAPTFSLWALDNDLLLLHSASVGVNGRGAAMTSPLAIFGASRSAIPSWMKEWASRLL